VAGDQARRFIVIDGIGNPQWYSDATVFGDLIWTSGVIPKQADGTISSSFDVQAATVVANLEHVLETAGGGLDTLIKTNVYLESLDDFPAFNEIYVERIGPHGLPPRTTVEIARFRPPMRIEIEAVAHRRNPSQTPAAS
jgi:2-iminobutanoate/2-iminopropanoate deaminase